MIRINISPILHNQVDWYSLIKHDLYTVNDIHSYIISSYENSQMKEWIDKNCKGKIDFTCVIQNKEPERIEIISYIDFSNNDDILLFKLAWKNI